MNPMYLRGTAGAVLVLIAALFTGCPPEFVWEKVTLTATVEGQGLVVPSGEFVKGVTVAVVAIPDAGWAFDHWAGALTGSSNPASLLLDADKAVTAVFIQTGGEGEGEVSASKDPGLNVEIQNVVIPDDLRPEITFAATDNNGVALIKSDLASVRFMLDYLETPAAGSTARYISYITRDDTTLGANPPAGASKTQANTDGAGNAGVTDNGDGTLTYKFRAVLPATYSRTATHAVGGQLSRVFTITGDPADNLTYYANPFFTFRPDGQPVTATREIVTTDACNACHTRLAFHGGGRREVEYCILCHTTQSTDAGSGNTLDMAQMIHKIHRGEGLPSVEEGTPYQIIGYGNSVNDYSDVAFPQDTRNCTVCHTGAPQSNVYLTKPTLEGCTSCHDRTWFGDPAQTPEGYTNHPFSQFDNSMCVGCHPATGTNTTIPSLNRVHRTPEQQSPDAPGLKLAFVGSPVLNRDGTVTITITVKKGDDSPVTDLSTLNRLSATIASPASEYQSYTTETIGGANAPTGTVDPAGAASGTYIYTFKNKPPTGTNATFAIGLEGRWQYTFDGTSYEQGPESNPVIYFTVDAGVEPVMRREIVDEGLCLACHHKFEMHGGQRVSVEYCVLCHNPRKTDESRRPADQMPPETVQFKNMIHKIHTGENLTKQPYIIYGFGSSANEFGDVLFPGDRRDCQICHLPNTVDLPLPAEAQPTVITQAAAVVDTILPTRAACTSCHDDPLVDTHAIVMSNAATGEESCAICHDATAAFSAATAHQMEP